MQYARVVGSHGVGLEEFYNIDKDCITKTDFAL